MLEFNIAKLSHFLFSLLKLKQKTLGNEARVMQLDNHLNIILYNRSTLTHSCHIGVHSVMQQKNVESWKKWDYIIAPWRFLSNKGINLVADTNMRGRPTYYHLELCSLHLQASTVGILQ